jgi:protease PrsW
LPDLGASRTFVLSLLPGLFWIVYLRSLSGGKVPAWWQWVIALTAGWASTELTLIASDLVTVQSLRKVPLVGALLYFVVGVGLVEEGAKAFCALLALKAPGFCEKPLFSLQLCGGVALGFATTENLLYAQKFGEGVLVGRLVFSTLAHILFASVWGFALGTHWAQNKEGGGYSKRTPWRSFLLLLMLSALAHGLFDWFLMTDRPVFAILTLVVLWVGFREATLAAYLHQEYRRELPFETAPCPRCSVLTRSTGKFCSYCGDRLDAV